MYPVPRRGDRIRVVAIAWILGLAAWVSSHPAGPARADEPVVIPGASIAAIEGVAPAAIVGYRYDSGWHRIAIQVDQRHMTDFGTVYGREPSNTTFLTYSDPGTFSGPDPDPGFDADDELVFLFGDAGLDPAPDVPPPEGTSPDTRIEILLRDPSDGRLARVYLFLATGDVAPVESPHPIAYDFVLLSGDYKTTYDFDGCLEPAGCNPEATTITTARYQVGFSDRWIRDETRWVDADEGPGFDRIDRHKTLFAPGQCERSELTFSRGPGAFLVNRSGPVRALRGYVGANSGPTTYRVHAFYPEREVILSVLRVHPIPGVVDFFDYAPGHGAMTYFNDLETAGVPVDGIPDNVPVGELTWEVVRWDDTGGSAAHAVRIDTDIPDFVRTSFYSDNANPVFTQCTGDAVEHGASGFRTFDIPNTDDNGGAAANRFRATHTIRWNDRSEGTAGARDLAVSIDRPVEVTVHDQSGGSGSRCADPDGDEFVDCDLACIPPPETLCGDCDEDDPAVNPGAAEVCGDGLDNDCDGAVDDTGTGSATWYQDADGDGFGDPAASTSACGQPAGFVADASDCDDTDPAVNPGAAEVCGDGLDNDCDGAVDDTGTGSATWYQDADGDGFGDPAASSSACGQPAGFVADASDCDDTDPAVNPGAAEVCGDGLDNDCDGAVDDTGTGSATWYQDADGDGFGDPAASSSACGQPAGFVADASDCDDTDPAVNPGAAEVCGDGLDNDCDGAVDDTGTGSATWYQDADGDGFGDPAASSSACGQPAGFVADASDCDDTDPAVNPGAAEVCGGRDEDCDTVIDNVACATYDWSDDQRVDAVELIALGRAFGACEGETRWFADADLDGNGCIDGDDLAALSAVWARVCGSPLEFECD